MSFPSVSSWVFGQSLHPFARCSRDSTKSKLHKLEIRILFVGAGNAIGTLPWKSIGKRGLYSIVHHRALDVSLKFVLEPLDQSVQSKMRTPTFLTCSS